MKELVYITKTNVAMSGAQAIQIRAMASVFSDILGSSFQLRAVSNEKKLNLKNFKPFIFKNRILFWLEFIFTVLTVRSKTKVFTRDIGVAFLAGIMGRQVVLEIHKPNTKLFPSILMLLTIRFRNVKYLTISKELERYIRRAYGLNLNRVNTEHSGAFPEKFISPSEEFLKDLYRKIGNQENMKLVVHTGSLYKGGAKLFGEIANNPELLILHVGGTQLEIDYWTNHYKEMRNIVLLPHQDESFVRDLQMTADLLLYLNVKSSPIYWCTSPLKMFEYMSTGKPIIATGTGSITEILSERNAFIFDPEIPGDFKKNLELAIQNKKEASKRSLAALEDVKKNHNWRLRAKRIIKYFNDNAS
tara:strand:- start:9140 stop:10216 length:1077 start_codon:yes stop_codon:yes gene_type:complete